MPDPKGNPNLILIIIGGRMQITSTLPITSVMLSSSGPSSAKARPEDYLTDEDIHMIERLSGTTSLAEAELNPNAKALAVSLGTKRENGWIQGDASKYYVYAQLTASDAKMIEGLTGTSTIIDAMYGADSDVTGLAMDIALDRTDGSLNGDVTADYLQKMIDFDRTQLARIQASGLPLTASGISVSIDTLNRAIEYLKGGDDAGAGTSVTT